MHSEFKRPECDICHRTFGRIENLRRHKTEVHGCEGRQLSRSRIRLKDGVNLVNQLLEVGRADGNGNIDLTALSGLNLNGLNLAGLNLAGFNLNTGDLNTGVSSDNLGLSPSELQARELQAKIEILQKNGFDVTDDNDLDNQVDLGDLGGLNNDLNNDLKRNLNSLEGHLKRQFSENVMKIEKSDENELVKVSFDENTEENSHHLARNTIKMENSNENSNENSGYPPIPNKRIKLSELQIQNYEQGEEDNDDDDIDDGEESNNVPLEEDSEMRAILIQNGILPKENGDNNNEDSNGGGEVQISPKNVQTSSNDCGISTEKEGEQENQETLLQNMQSLIVKNFQVKDN